MMRLVSLLWLMLSIVAGIYVATRFHEGMNFRTDLMALLPQDQKNPAEQEVNDEAIRVFSHHIVLLVGDPNRDHARAAAATIMQKLVASGEVTLTTDTLDQARLRRIGAFYFPYRQGLLSRDDRHLLMDDKGSEVAGRALSRAYGMMGFISATMLREDPFLLMTDFFTGLSTSTSRLALDDGMLSVQDQGMTWVMISGQLLHEPFALTVQKTVVGMINKVVEEQRQQDPDLQILRLGAVFFAKAGADQALHETSLIGIASLICTILFVWLIFRAFRPILLSVLAIVVGILVALAGSLWIFGELHVGAMLFGTSLIGVAVDYSLQYCCEIFSPHQSSSHERLRRIFMAITLGMATTVIGYLTLLLAPFPGLQQIALFSVMGLIGAWLTVVAWFPWLDKTRPFHHGQSMLRWSTAFLDLWENPQKRWVCYAVLLVVTISGTIGLYNLPMDDDVHHMQSLNPALVDEQKKIAALTGIGSNSQFFVVEAATSEQALQAEERLMDRLDSLVRDGGLMGFQAMAQYVPSVERQMENRMLVKERLEQPYLSQQAKQLRLTKAPILPNKKQTALTPEAALKANGPFPFLSMLDISKDAHSVTHIVVLDDVKKADLVAVAAQNIPGVRYLDPASDFSHLLGTYRGRALLLLALSAGLMMPLLVGRYGFRKGLWIMVPPLLAVLLTPGLRSLFGASFTFFDAMALVLILSIGVDYTIFCAETSHERKAVTMLAVTMAACTALLSFGLLALSRVMAVHNFGTTMLIGIFMAFLLAPMARFPIVKMAKGFFALCLVVCLIGCAHEEVSSTTTIAPDVIVALPQITDLNQSLEVTQLVTGQYGDQTFVFEVRLSATPDSFHVVGVDMMGRRAIEINWTKNGIAYERAPWVPSELGPENILTDMILLYWPEPVVRQSLRSSATLLVKPNDRTIIKNGVKVFEVTYQPTAQKDIWIGRLHYNNFVRGYQLDVQSTKIAP